MTIFKKRELDFLASHELCRLATASKKRVPHVVPVIYAMDREDIIIAIDYGTKKLKNLRENKHVALVVDDSDSHRGLMVQAGCEILERGEEYLRLQRILYDKFEYYRKNPWKEGESPILKLHPTKVAYW